MARVSDVILHLERIAPKRYAFPFDKVGLQVGREHSEITRAVVSLDRSLGAIEFAAASEAQLLVAHHPLIFTPLETVDDRSHTSRSVLRLAELGIAFIAAHTNWDSALGGVNDVLATMLNLSEVKSFGTGAKVTNHKLVFFCPSEAVPDLESCLFEAGAGVIGNYSECSFQSEGIGRFLGSRSTHPRIGEPNAKTSAQEHRVEMLLPQGTEKAAIRTLLKHHPYETPAYDVYPLKEQVEQAAGRIGVLPERTSFEDFTQNVDEVLSTRSYAWGDLGKTIRKVAVVGGAADGEWIAAQRAGADVLVTGEVKQHIAVEASESGLCILASGHYATEHPGAAELKVRLAAALPQIDWILFEPEAGSHGRPRIFG